jgi:hypothetical protein
VLRLITRGLSNAVIGGTLVITEDTTKTHVRHLLAKLNLRDHAQAVVLACETGLVMPAADYPRPARFLSCQCAPALYTLHSASVGERRAAQMAGSNPARTALNNSRPLSACFAGIVFDCLG